MILDFVVGSMQCFSVVENPEFKHLIQTLLPRRTVMTRKTLVLHLNNAFGAMKAAVTASLGEASTVCCTADCWTACNSIFGGHNAEDADESITDELHRTPDDIQLPKHHRCAAHTLNLVATVDSEKAQEDPLYGSVSDSVFTKCKALWKQQKQSVQAAEVIKEKLGRYLPVPNATRWNSTYVAMDFMNNVGKPMLDNVFDALCLPRLKRDDVAFINEYCQAMSGVAKALDILQGQDYMYMGTLLPTIQSLLRRLDTLPPMRYCTPLVTTLSAALRRRFSDQLAEPSFVIAAAVHPRFKFSWLGEGERKRAIGLVKEEYEAAAPVEGSPLSEGQDGEGADDDFFILQSTPGGSELDRWKKSPRGGLQALNDFPLIKDMFIKFNTGIPSSAPVERLFSVGRDTFGLKRGKLTDENFEKQLLLKCNKNFHGT
ncbi:uncharacterized protein LOC135379067 [Ornithodoros turicata]|uniref:uncharacterized protein LOC135379067 n=1 Tax=Ornithodoros turicata TaxID=34597 RepID=UPI00313898BD